MAETYCGKSCKECAQMAQGLCTGCKTGPGRKFAGDCKLASCVQEKGHETCDTCGFHEGCGKYRDRYQVPEERRRYIEEEAARRSLVAQRAAVLGKWLWILFWIVVPNTIGGFMANDYTKESFPMIYGAGELIQFVCSFVYGGILLKLAVENDMYRTAGVCILVVCVVSGLTAGIPSDQAWSLVISIPLAVVGLYGTYSEYMAHAAALEDVDSELSQKWENLWKWNIGLNIGLICSAFLILIPFLGALIMLSIAIGILVVSILKLVYLYQTAKLFREYQ